MFLLDHDDEGVESSISDELGVRVGVDLLFGELGGIEFEPFGLVIHEPLDAFEVGLLESALEFLHEDRVLLGDGVVYLLRIKSVKSGDCFSVGQSLYYLAKGYLPCCQVEDSYSHFVREVFDDADDVLLLSSIRDHQSTRCHRVPHTH